MEGLQIEFGVKAVVSRVRALGCRVQGLRFRVQGLRLRGVGFSTCLTAGCCLPFLRLLTGLAGTDEALTARLLASYGSSGFVEVDPLNVV